MIKNMIVMVTDTLVKNKSMMTISMEVVFFIEKSQILSDNEI